MLTGATKSSWIRSSLCLRSGSCWGSRRGRYNLLIEVWWIGDIVSLLRQLLSLIWIELVITLSLWLLLICTIDASVSTERALFARYSSARCHSLTCLWNCCILFISWLIRPLNWRPGAFESRWSFRRRTFQHWLEDEIALWRLVPITNSIVALRRRVTKYCFRLSILYCWVS